MLNKQLKRHRRAAKTRVRIAKRGTVRLCLYRSLQNFYAQLIVREAQGDRVLLSASTLDKEVKSVGVIQNGKLVNTIQTARIVGKILAKRAQAQGISKVAFDRSGYKYHGRVKALAESAREAGLTF
jgi:large subunit ribosomal protein L18